MQRIEALPRYPDRMADSHKGSFGKVLIIAGSRGMSGAAALSGLGALRGGAGLVTLAVPQGIAGIVAALEPAYLLFPQPEDEAGGMAEKSRWELARKIVGMDVVAVGPGCGPGSDFRQLVRWLYGSVDLPLVLDADALNALAALPEFPAPVSAPRILTPHPGEFARLTGKSIAEIAASRETLAFEFARRHRLVLLLKGHQTIVTDGERLAVNRTGNSGMATGGSGDVLTGLITALIAQNLPAFDAARLAAHLHGLAGDLAAAELSQPGLIASDLPRYLGAAWKQLLQEQGG